MMEEYVQYHNSTRHGWLSRRAGPFAIYTSKPVRNMVGHRVWLISRRLDTKEYCLVYCFSATRVTHGFGGEPNLVHGRTGTWFDPPIQISHFPWFPAFRHYMGNFGLGLQRVADPELAGALRAAARLESSAGSSATSTDVPPTAGGGFGDVLSNPEVERAAVAAVQKVYRSQGWRVKSVEAKQLGYDLLCTKSHLEEHVEIKGVSGNARVFIITAGELECSRRDPQYVLYVVTGALTSPQLNRYPGPVLGSEFEFQPIQFTARPRTPDSPRRRP